jgi:hypothetical protein
VNVSIDERQSLGLVVHQEAALHYPIVTVTRLAHEAYATIHHLVLLRLFYLADTRMTIQDLDATVQTPTVVAAAAVQCDIPRLILKNIIADPAFDPMMDAETSSLIDSRVQVMANVHVVQVLGPRVSPASGFALTTLHLRNPVPLSTMLKHVTPDLQLWQAMQLPCLPIDSNGLQHYWRRKKLNWRRMN